MHGNGYGHLIRVNGIGPGNRVLTGGAIVQLWTRLCSRLNIVAVSTEDVSSKVALGGRVEGNYLLALTGVGSWWTLCSNLYSLTLAVWHGIEGAAHGGDGGHVVWPVWVPVRERRLQDNS